MADRTEEIVLCCKEAINGLEDWMKSIREGDSRKLPRHVIVAIQYADEVCHQGDAPSGIQQLCVIALPKLAEELRQYLDGADGSVQPGGLAGSAFWKAASDVKKLLSEADAVCDEQLEPVHSLLAQKVTPEQIARHIYGWRGEEGPFILKNGMVDYAKLYREAANPGTEVPKEWVHPSKISATKARAENLKKELEAYKRLIAGPKKYVDPSSVEEMLADGCYIGQIERGKGVSRQEILETAERLGIVAKDGPTPIGTFMDHNSPSRVQQQIAPLAPRDVPSESGDGNDGGISQGDRDAIISLWHGNPSLGSPDLAALLKESGIDVSSHAVAGAIRAYKNAEKKKQMV